VAAAAIRGPAIVLNHIGNLVSLSEIRVGVMPAFRCALCIVPPRITDVPAVGAFGRKSMQILRQTVTAIAAVAALTAVATTTASAKWPMDKPMTLVVNWPAGTGADVLGRIIADGLQKKWGITIVVENRPGATGNIGQAYVAKQAPDGYTWLHTSPGPAANNMVSFKSLPYNPLTDFTSVTMTNETDMILVARNGLGKDLKEIIAKAKAAPESIKLAHPGIGTYAHMLGLRIEEATGTKMNMVPYKGSPQMLPDLMSGNIDLVGDQIPTYVQQVQSGKITAVATFGTVRSPLLPNVPTMKELGFEIFAAPWYGLQGPKGIPADITEEMAKAVAEVLKDPANAEKLKAANYQPKTSTPAQFSKTIIDEVATWGPVIKKYNLYVD
jgi:tripartite-type tricarboxylate transporter receptor subunit TctC